MEPRIMVRAKRASTAERPTQPSLDLRSRAPWFYPDRYRALAQDFETEGPRGRFDMDVVYHGPQFGVVFRF